VKITVPQASIRRILRWSQLAFFTAAAATLGYAAFVVADSWIYQRQAGRALERMDVRLHPPAGPDAAATGGLLGRIEIPRLGLSAIVTEGTAARTLRRSVGHIEGTGLPGRSGNVGIAGHRDTLFRPLQNIRQDDVILLTTLQGAYRYRVVSMKIVGPSDVEVLNPDGHEILTLVTCHPFYLVGPAPNRFVVRAKRIA
jgi:sortase A